MVNSLQSSVDLILKPPYAKTPWSPSSSDEYYQRDTLFASGMHPSIKESAIKDFFAVVGQVEVEFDTEEHEHGKEATIRFESDEQATKGLKLKGNQCFGRPLYLRRFPNSLYTIYVKGFDTSLPEHEIKVQLIEHFSRTTDVKGLYFRRDKEGLIRGAYINMIDDPQIVQILDQTLIKGRKLTVESLQLRKARKAAKVEMKRNHVDPSMKPGARRLASSTTKTMS